MDVTLTARIAPVGTLRTAADLVADGLIPAGDASAVAGVAERYAIAITPEMAAVIDRADPGDPIARQFVPSVEELAVAVDESADPIGDGVHEKVPGLIHRYPDRVLLKLTHACPVYCRFCFRREMVGPGGEQVLDDAAFERALAYIAADERIFEVILTGGDPLVLSPRRIEVVTRRLSAIPHVAVIRWHSRIPIVSPERVTGGMVSALKATEKAVWIGIHTNHARELTVAARAAIGRLAEGGLTLVSQTVLLAGVNDDAETLAELFRALVSLRVKPYYLHHMDRAPGTARFRTSIAQGQAIMRRLRGMLSGLAQPVYVLDIPGGVAKVPILPAYVTGEDRVSDPWGRMHSLSPGPLA